MTERLDRFMARANAAYYATHDPFADFTTAPEISQVFGEILGLWAAIMWRQMGSPAGVVLAEAGPGRGTLMRDALRAIGSVAPDFRAALSIHLVETSPRLRAAQAALLPDAIWHDDIATLPGGPLLLLANEFLDALPIRQLVRRGGGWREIFVGPDGSVEEPACPKPSWSAEADHPRLPDGGEKSRGSSAFAKDDGAPEGTVLERCEPALAIAAALGARFAATPGAALFLDYGPAKSAAGNSLQALRGGKPADPLADPGAADLTAHVDFAALADTAAQAGARAHGPLAQGLFLARLGLFQRTDRLARTQPPAQASALIEAARRLAEPDRMGRLFKALALCHPACPTPPGFDAE